MSAQDLHALRENAGHVWARIIFIAALTHSIPQRLSPAAAKAPPLLA
ncbi:MAG: hypothetical protein ABL956_07140 [Hyphomonadaceae bacterium]